MPSFYSTQYPHLEGATAGPSARLANALSSFVMATTSVPEDTVVEGLTGCPGRGGRCRGEVVAVRFGGNVRWACGGCGAAGVVTHWEGTAVDRRSGPPEERPMAGSLLSGPVSGWPKISGTLTTFARPGLAGIAPVPAAWERALVLPTTVWNAVTLADYGGRGQWLEDVQRRVVGEPGVTMLVDMLIARKRRLFAADFRTITVDQVELIGGTMWVRATARDGRT